MNRIRHVVFSVFLAFAAGAMLATQASAANALYTQDFESLVAGGLADAALVELTDATTSEGIDWWHWRARNWNNSFDLPNKVGNTVTNASITLASSAYAQFFATPPVTTSVGEVTFKVLVRQNGKRPETTPKVSVFLGSSNDYHEAMTLPSWPNVEGVEAFSPVAIDIAQSNVWVSYSHTFNRLTGASDPKRVFFARCESDKGYDLLFDDIVVYEALSTLSVEDDLYVTANSEVADPSAAVTAIEASSSASNPDRTLAPHVSFTTFGAPADVAVTLSYRTMPGGTWQTLPFSTATTNAETGVITYALQGGTIGVGTASGTQIEMYATATYGNANGTQSVALANSASNPLRIDILPRSPQFDTHTNLVVAGAIEAPMDASTNGVWVGVLERGEYTPGAINTWCFDFGEGVASTSRSYGSTNSIPFKASPLATGGAFPAPESLDRDVIFRYEEVGNSTRRGTALTGEAQTFEDWAGTQGNGWALAATNGSAVVSDATLALHGAGALYLAPGDSLVLDKTAHPGVKEIGFWMRRADSATNAVVSLLRHRVGTAVAQAETLATFAALPTDRYVFRTVSIAAAQNPMETDGIGITATTPVYIDSVYVSDCSRASLTSLSFDPEPPLKIGDTVTVSATFTMADGARFRDGDNKVAVMWGQGNSAASVTNSLFATYDTDSGAWTATLPEIERGDVDLYVYVTADAFDFGGESIGTITSATNCLSTVPSSNFETLDICRNVGGAEDTTPMLLAANGLWKGVLAPPDSAQANVVFQFKDDLESLYGGEDGSNEIPAGGDIVDEGSITAETVTSALAFEFNETEWSYNARSAKYAPLTAAVPAGWSTTGNITTSAEGTLFPANATLISTGNTGVGQVWFFAKRTTNANVGYRVEYSTSDTGNSWLTTGVSGATGTIASETLRYYAATVGNNNAKRIRITFTGGTALVKDVVVTASGSFVTMSSPKISTTENVADAVASATTNGPTVAYGSHPWVWINVAPENGARDIRVNVEAVSVDENGTPLEGAEVAIIPMEGDPDIGGTFIAEMPTLPAGLTGYRFVATYEGVDATQTVNPTTGYYVYETDSDLETLRTPDFSSLPHNNNTLSRTIADGSGQAIWQFTRCFMDLALVNSIGFQSTAGVSIFRSRQAFNGIGRIYFKAHKQIDANRSWVRHYLDVEISDDGNSWESMNSIEIPFGMTEADDTQFCIEVNSYDSKYVRFVRSSSDDDESCKLFLRDVVVTPPSANVELTMPSIIHPGYPSQNDDISFRVDVASVYDDYPAVAFRPVLHWRRYNGATPGAWQVVDMTSSDGESYTCTLPAQSPGRIEYYNETHFSGAAYDYTTSDTYDANRPLQFYYAYDDTVYDHDPKNFKEGSSPSYLYSAQATPREFSIEAQQRALYGPGTVEGDATNPYFWFKVRAFVSHHRELQFVYTNALEQLVFTNEVDSSTIVTTNAPTWYTNSLQLVGDETWLTTISIPETVRFFGHILGVEPYEGSDSTEYGDRPTTWGDRNQTMTNAPLASVASVGATTPPIVAYLGTEEPVLMMVRLDTTTRAYQIRRAAYQNFNDWSADPTYFEDSTGLYDTMTYEEAFDDSSLYGLTEMDWRQMTFQADGTGSDVVTRPTDANELDTYYTSYGWRLRNAWILRERMPEASNDKSANIAAVVEPRAGYLENTSGDSALTEGLDYVSFRYRSSFGGNGHLPYYKGGFDWKNYTMFVNNAVINELSPSHPYIQIIAGYADEDNYVALRLTQMRELGSTKVQNWVKQEIIKVQNGVESVVPAKSFKNMASPSGGNVMSNRFDNVLLTGGGWYLSLSVTNNSIDARAYPGTWATWDSGKKGTNCLYASGALVGTDSVEGGTISFDAFDARVTFGGINVRAVGDATNSTTRVDKWNLGGVQKGGSATRWESTVSGVSNKIPPLPFTIGVCEAGTSTSFPGDGTYQTVYTGNAGSLAYVTVKQPVHYWGNTFVRITPQSSDASLVLDDVETQSWHGRALPESAPNDESQWQAREAVVVTHNNSRQLALTTSRADPSARQMVSTPEMLQGIGTISFNYEVEGGSVAFVIERNSESGQYADGDLWVELDSRTVPAGGKGEVFIPVRLDMRGKIRVRVLHEASDEDATLYIDNLFAKGFPPDDGRSWTAYNALIVAPTRNGTTDPLQFEEDISTQSSFLNNHPVTGTRPNNPLEDHMPYVQSPVINTGVGEIGFWYRVWDPSQKGTDGETIPGKLTLWVAEVTSAEEQEWRQITVDDLAKPEEPAPGAPQGDWDSYHDKLEAFELQKAQFDNLSCITNGTYQYFTAEICNDTNYVLRICADTNGTQRVAIDNVLVTEPVRASIDILSVGMYPNDIPLGFEPVGFEVLLGNPRMNPTDIHVFAEYYIGTNVWGVANWASRPDGAIELVQDSQNEFLYRSAAGDMIPGLPVDSVVQYRVRVTYTGTFASPVVDTSFDNPEWYEPIDLNEIYGSAGNTSPYYWVFSCPTGVVHINEFYPSFGASYNTREFVELIGPANLSLEGWMLDVVEGRDSQFEDAINVTYTLPAEAKFSDPGETQGWGFFVIGDNGEEVVDKVDLVWANPETANLPPTAANRGGGLRLRRSMGAYVDLVSYGGGNNGNPANAMADRGYTFAGTRLNLASYAQRVYSLETTPGEEGDEWRWNYQKSGSTMGEMNSEEAAELWDVCPFTASEELASATAVALSQYFDKRLPADFLIALTLDDSTQQSLTGVAVDGSSLTLGTGYTSEVTATNENVFVVTLKADALSALALSTNEAHTVRLTVDKSLAPTVQLVVIESAESGGDGRSTSITPEITDFRLENGTATLTLVFTNDDDGTTAEGWKWAILSSPDVGFSNVTTNGWTALTDADLDKDVETSLPVPANSDAQFYKAVTTDEP